MTSLLRIVLVILDFNLTNMTLKGIMRASFEPFTNIFGSYFIGMILGVIGVAVYVEERSLGHMIGYLIIVGVFFSIIIPVEISALVGLIAGIVLTRILYKAFAKKVEQ